MKFTRALAALSAFVLLAACATGRTDLRPVRVLFVGNSLTYVGNLPAVFDALAARSGRPTYSEMLVKGGATLAQRLADGSVERALQDRAYDVVVMQERGGDFVCAFGPDSCEQADIALGELALLAQRFHARPVLLGAYQKNPGISQGLVNAESSASSKYSMTYVPVSDALQLAIADLPSDNWLNEDGMHPGHDLALLEAVRLYRELFDALPRAGDLVVSAPMYPPSAHFPVAVVDGRKFEPSNTQVARSHVYSSEVVSRVIEFAGKHVPATPHGE